MGTWLAASLVLLFVLHFSYEVIDDIKVAVEIKSSFFVMESGASFAFVKEL